MLTKETKTGASGFILVTTATHDGLCGTPSVTVTPTQVTWRRMKMRFKSCAAKSKPAKVQLLPVGFDRKLFADSQVADRIGFRVRTFKTAVTLFVPAAREANVSVSDPVTTPRDIAPTTTILKKSDRLTDRKSTSDRKVRRNDRFAG